MKNRWVWVPITILILSVGAEIAWYSPYGGAGQGSFSVLHVSREAGGELTNVSIEYRLDAGLPLQSTVVVTPVIKTPQNLPIYVFYDVDYPQLETDWTVIAMLQGYLEAELYLRGYTSAVKLASAEEVENIMLDNESGIVIMASGAFPSCVFSKVKNLVKPWIESGGVLVWLGFYIGYYAVDKGTKPDQITYNMTQNPRENGSSLLGLGDFFEYYALESNPQVATLSSPLSEALGTTYTLIQQAPLTSMVTSNGGLALGKIGGENLTRLRSSISMIPIGKGEIIIFGYSLMPSLALNGPESVAWDIAQIVCSGVIDMNPEDVPWYQTYHLSGGKEETNSANLMVGSDVIGVEVLVYTMKESDGVLFSREFMEIWH
jgi:hypothetical protein